MLKIISQLLAQLNIFYLLTKTMIFSFDFPILNTSMLVEDTTQRPTPHPSPALTRSAISSSSATCPLKAVLLPSTQARSQRKPHGSSKQRTPKTKKPRCKITPKINELSSPGLQCTTM